MSASKFKIIFFLLFIVSLKGFSQETWINIDLLTNTNIRGLSVVNDKTVWVSGSNGWTGLSTDGGHHWSMTQVPGFEKLDFRSIYAFDAKHAVIANAGNPGSILTTEDGGKHWTIVLSLTDTNVFFDGIDFWNRKEGIIYGDPINGKLLLYKTADGGLHWNAVPDSCRPILSENENSFAASGTGIRCYGKQSLIICTGGSVTRLLTSENAGSSWDTIHTPMIHGSSSTGIFSVTQYKNQRIVVGGDFLRDSLKQNHVFYSEDAGKNWVAPNYPTRGYRECVEMITSQFVLATGPSGADISTDGGKTWEKFNDEKSFHVIRKSRKGNLIIAAGKGKIGILHFKIK